MCWRCWNGCEARDGMSKRLETIMSRISADMTATSATLNQRARMANRANPSQKPVPTPSNGSSNGAGGDEPRQPPLLAPGAGEPPRFYDGVGDPNCPFCHGLGYLRE